MIGSGSRKRFMSCKTAALLNKFLSPLRPIKKEKAISLAKRIE